MIFSCRSFIQVVILVNIFDVGLISSIPIEFISLLENSKTDIHLFSHSHVFLSSATRIFRLLQLENLDETLRELDQIVDDINSWTFDGLRNRTANLIFVVFCRYNIHYRWKCVSSSARYEPDCFI